MYKIMTYFILNAFVWILTYIMDFYSGWNIFGSYIDLSNNLLLNRKNL